MARTQAQRREETVARLLDASIATIIDVGCARASAAVITRRARLSGGAAIVRAVLPLPDVEAARIPLLLALLDQGRTGNDD